MVKCKSCGKNLDVSPDEPCDKRTACPSCGSKSRVFEVTSNVSVGNQVSFKMKAKHKDSKRPFIEERSGRELFIKTGEFTDRQIVVDRENNAYVEIIKDHKTGEIIHECKEALSKHVGHGDAKKKMS